MCNSRTIPGRPIHQKTPIFPSIEPCKRTPLFKSLPKVSIFSYKQTHTQGDLEITLMAAEDLPQYSEMVMEAIEALDDKDGSNKTAINEHIAAKYGEQLPEDYYSQLSDQLNQMKESGELIQVKNNYMKPGSYVPPKRGRGRPPKDKIPVPEGYAVGPTRPRGRPPKTASSPKKASAPGSGKPRGRPAKKAKVVEADDEDEDEKESSEEVTLAPVKTPSSGAARGRGRPSKVKNLDAQVVA